MRGRKQKRLKKTKSVKRSCIVSELSVLVEFNLTQLGHLMATKKILDTIMEKNMSAMTLNSSPSLMPLGSARETRSSRRKDIP